MPRPLRTFPFRSPTLATARVAVPQSRCPAGEEWDTIDNVCRNMGPAQPRHTSVSAPSATPIRDRCPTDEYWDKIEQSCYPKDAQSSPPGLPTTVALPSAPPAPVPELEEDIDEGGFSTVPPSKGSSRPIPDSDSVRNGGPGTVARPSVTIREHRTSVIPDPSPEGLPFLPKLTETEPFYKSPIVLVGGVALVAWLVLRK